MSGKIFLIADTHFGDEAIIRYENRPFQNADEMAQIMIEKWNTCVGLADQVYVLGDFALGSKEEISELCRRLNGKKYLVMGNHDIESPKWYRQCGFEQAVPWPIILDNFWILSHEPLYINANMPYANLFGHVHKNAIYSDVSPQSMCLCAERIDYQPIAFEAVKRRILEAAKQTQ